MNKVFDVPLQLDLTEFAEFLWKHEIPHRIVQTSDCQQVWVTESFPSDQVISLFELWQQGHNLDDLQVSIISSTPKTTSRLPQLSFSFSESFLTLIVGVLTIGVTALTHFGVEIAYLKFFTITELIEYSGAVYTPGIVAMFKSGEWWRLITPVLLHFNLPHLLFNLLWFWVIGAKIERLQGRRVWCIVFVAAALGSNLGQFVVSGPLFGGLSGVVFAQLAYVWYWDRLKTPFKFGFPSALMGLMVIWLMLGYSGLLEAAGLGAVANTAHLIGLLSGLLSAWLISRFSFR